MHKVYVTLLTALLALGPGAATASEASEPEAAKSSARNTVPTGTPQSKRDHKEEWKDTAPPPPPRVKRPATPPPVHLPSPPVSPRPAPAPSGG